MAQTDLDLDMERSRQTLNMGIIDPHDLDLLKYLEVAFAGGVYYFHKG